MHDKRSDMTHATGMNDVLLPVLTRIAEALERIAPLPSQPDFRKARAFLWQGDRQRLLPVAEVPHVPLELLKGIDDQKDTLLANTRRFAKGLPANNALLWGARGMGKSALVKAVWAQAGKQTLLIEIHRDEIHTLPTLLELLRASDRRFLLFCDDLSFDSGDKGYKPLKALLEGGIAGRPENVLFYATSNRRHLLAREASENEQQGALIPGEVVEEHLSLSDRFGLWLGFHPCDQDTYLEIAESYARHFKLKLSGETLKREALEWSAQRGARSGRTAWQFIQNRR